jgi:hypothetical protein
MPTEINTKAPSSISSNTDSEYIHMRKLGRSIKDNGSMTYGTAKAPIICSMGRSRSRALGKEQS